MGGGVGVGCHGSHRIVGESAQIAMPECGIGLVPDVGGSLILARAPGRLGEYLGVTSARMGPGDAILAGFADYYVPEAGWAALTAELVETGDWAAVDRSAHPAPAAPLADALSEIDRLFRRREPAGNAGCHRGRNKYGGADRTKGDDAQFAAGHGGRRGADPPGTRRAG